MEVTAAIKDVPNGDRATGQVVRTIGLTLAGTVLAAGILAGLSHFFDRGMHPDHTQTFLNIDGQLKAISSKLDIIVNDVRINERAIMAHKAEKGIHQTPEEKRASTYEQVNQILDTRLKRVEDLILSLQHSLQSYVVQDRQSMLERLLKLETQQETILKRLEDLQTEIKKQS
jgi:hypothetical protein